MKYFEVVAKCGHVGRMYYYEGHFFVSGDSKKIAAGKVKTTVFSETAKGVEEEKVTVKDIEKILDLLDE